MLWGISMKVFSLSLLFVGFGTIAAPWTSQAKLSDFLCKADPSVTSADFFDGSNTHFRDCSAQPPDPNLGLCQERVQCAFISVDQKAEIVSRYKTAHPGRDYSFDDLPAVERIEGAAKLKSKLSFHSSTVNCQVRVPAGETASCPSPDDCKGDALIVSKTAKIDSGAEVPRKTGIFVPEGGASSSGGALPSTHDITIE
jgi:hypothetical protein